MNRYLILNADDFGMCHASTMAVIQLLEANLISSATLMTPCPWFPTAAAYASQHPEKCVGLHLTFTSEWQGYRWGPVSRQSVASLTENGVYFPSAVLAVEQNAQPEEVEREIRAQIALAEQAGVILSHLDNHMGSLYGIHGIQSYLPLIFQICAERGWPFRLPTAFLPGDAIGENLSPQAQTALGQLAELARSMGVIILDCLLSHPYEKQPGETYETFRDSVCQKLICLPEGIHELYIHPALDTPELHAILPEWEKRTWEFRLPGDPVFQEVIARQGIQIIDWRQIKKLRES